MLEENNVKYKLEILGLISGFTSASSYNKKNGSWKDNFIDNNMEPFLPGERDIFYEQDVNRNRSELVQY